MNKYRIVAFFLALLLFIQAIRALTPTAAAADSTAQTITQQEVTEALLALQEEYPDGMPWTNQSPTPAYVWRFKGTLVCMGGCAAFSAILQDRVFGSIADVSVTWQRIKEDCKTGGVSECAVPYSWDNLWPGDILQFPGHVVIVVEKFEDHITIAEGNFNGQIRWGRTISKAGVNSANYVLTRYSKTEPLMPYTDLPERRHWSYAPVTWALLENVAAPISATHFAPKASCTRAEMVSFLWAASGRPEPEPQEMPFTDVPASAPYYKAVLWALQQHITSGTSAASFSPAALCSRAQALTFLWRAAGSPKPDGSNEIFDDVPSSKYYFTTVAWALQQHITSGTSAHTFSPRRTITRAEALAFLCSAKIA